MTSSSNKDEVTHTIRSLFSLSFSLPRLFLLCQDPVYLSLRRIRTFAHSRTSSRKAEERDALQMHMYGDNCSRRISVRPSVRLSDASGTERDEGRRNEERRDRTAFSKSSIRRRFSLAVTGERERWRTGRRRRKRERARHVHTRTTFQKYHAPTNRRDSARPRYERERERAEETQSRYARARARYSYVPAFLTVDARTLAHAAARWHRYTRTRAEPVRISRRWRARAYTSAGRRRASARDRVTAATTRPRSRSRTLLPVIRASISGNRRRSSPRESRRPAISDLGDGSRSAMFERDAKATDRPPDRPR